MDRTATVNVRLLEREAGIEAGVYGGAKSIQLLLDDVRVGDTLWITYTTEGQNPVFGERWAQDFSWDRGTPVELRRLTVLHPAKQQIYWRQLGDVQTGAITPVIDRVGDLERMRFEGKGIEAVQFEPSVPSDFIPVRRVQVSEYPDWHAVASWADGLFPRAAPSPALKQLASRFAAEKSRLAQASAALHWVQDEIRYFSVSIGENSHRPQVPDTVLARRYGDCKDKSYLLISLLAQLGIEARPMLVSAEAPAVPGKIIPSPFWFDHVIVRIELDGEVFYVDPTRTGQKGLLTRLPRVLPGAMGLLVAADSQALLTLPKDDAQFPLIEVQEKIVIASFDGDAALESHQVYRGEYADWARRRFPVMAAAALKKELLARYEKGYQGVSLAQAPTLVDDPEGGRFEVFARFTLTKPVRETEGRHSIDFDSQIIEDTVTTPAKLVRSFPYRLPQGVFRGRYRLNVRWPTAVRAGDLPVRNIIDNRFFVASEEYTFRGNSIDYLLDYRVKAEQVAADAVPELSTLAKKLNPLAAGGWHVFDNVVMSSSEASGFSYRNLESVKAAVAVAAIAKELGKGKDGDLDAAGLCAIGLRGLSLPDDTDRVINTARGMAQLKQPGARRCAGQILFAKAHFTESIPLLLAEPLKDDDQLMPNLAWAHFYAGDAKAALAAMQRYRVARGKSGGLNGFDIANAIALLQRAGESVPPELLAYGQEVPDGPWPRPLVAMQAGLIGEQALIDIANALPADARDMALNDAWFFIGQRRLVAKDNAGAKRAFAWFAPNGLRSTREYWMARHERTQFESKDPDYLAGMAASVSNDYAAAISKWRAAAARTDAYAQYQLALVHYNGDGVKTDYAEALRWARMAADQDIPGAMNLLGNLYDDGLGVPRDSAQGAVWHQRAAEQFDRHGMFNLGNHYLYGRGPIGKDPVKAFPYLRQSAELEHAQAQAALARMYFEGWGVAVDDTQALFWASQASDHGDTDGKFQLAKLYELGRGVSSKDPARAAKFMRAAAEAGNAKAMAGLAYYFQEGVGEAKNPKLAFAWFEKAGKAGNCIGRTMTGYFFRDGIGVGADSAKALALLEKAALSGCLAAYRFLRDMFLDGIGTPKDPARGWAFALQGAEAGDPDSQQFVAIRMQFGSGAKGGSDAERDYAGAARWYRKAADQGMLLSLNNLGDLYENGLGVTQDYSQAVKLYRQAATAGLPIGFISLGTMYERGLGVAGNPTLAYACYEIALRTKRDSDNDTGAPYRVSLAARLNAAQRAEAEALAAAWKPGSPLPGDSANKG
jgi:TPR repeat protein/transglutaminase-like putative cysteine protease